MSQKDYVLIAAALRRAAERARKDLGPDAGLAVDYATVQVCDALETAHNARPGYAFKRSVFLSAAGHSNPLTS